MSKEKLSGVFAPVVTPFDNDEVRYDWLRENLEKLGETELKGYLALGSNGEFMSLTREEQIEVLKVFAKYKGNKIVMAGTARESTRETVEFSCQVADMGVDFVSILTPHYFAKRTTDDVLIRYYTEVADNVPIPVLLYNAPGFTGGVQISPQTVLELSKHANIAGMKDSSPAGPARFLNILDASEDFHVLAGSANFFYPSLHLGAIGGILSLANSFPDICCELYHLYIKGRYNEARMLHFRIARLNTAVSGTYGVPGVKAAMNITGFRGGEPRHPLKPISDDAMKIIHDKILEEEFSID